MLTKLLKAVQVVSEWAGVWTQAARLQKLDS